MSVAPDFAAMQAMNAEAKARAKAKAFAAFTVEIIVDGQATLFRAGSVRYSHTAEYRRQTGSTKNDPVMYLILAVVTDESPDEIGELLWFAKRQQGEKVTVAEVLDSLTYDQVVEVRSTGELTPPEDEGVVFPDPLS